MAKGSNTQPPPPSLPPYVVATWAIDKLKPYDRNARIHGKEQIQQLRASFREFGQVWPILVREDGTIIAGHGRLEAAKAERFAEVQVIVANGWSEGQCRAFGLLDNRVPLNAEWDDEKLGQELRDLAGAGVDLEDLGYSPGELEDFVEKVPVTAGETDPDAAPEPPVVPVTRLGDLWVLGRHRLLCGDSTRPEDATRLLAGDRAHLVFTDPPYGMSYGGGRAVGKTDGTVKGFGVILGDEKRGVDLIALVKEALSAFKEVTDAGAAWYVCFPWRTYTEFLSGLHAIELKPSSCIVWDKQSIGLGSPKGYRPQHEFIFYVAGERWLGDRAQSDVWSATRGSTSGYVHPTQKPVELIERALINSSKSGEIVADCFGGSGSTLIACEHKGRLARLMELDPKYCDVIIRRWQEFAGAVATLDGDGRDFATVAAERVPKAA